MTVSAGNNNLHGTLRFLSRKYCPTSRKASNKRARAGVPIIRKSSTRRSDRLQVVSITAAESGTESGEFQSNQPTKNTEVTGTLLAKTEVKVETPVSTAPAANISGSIGASDAVKEPALQAKTIEAKQPAADATKKTTTTTTIKFFHTEDLAQCQEAEKTQQEALKRIERARKKVYNDQVQQVWGVYMYGLKHVLALNDLSDAPDAILPGNF